VLKKTLASKKDYVSGDQFRMLYADELCDSHLLEDYRLIVERRFACPNDPESYAGGSISQTGPRVGARRSVAPDPRGLGLGVGLTTPPRKIYSYKIMEELKTHTGL
jgi:hypothetical protein